MSDPRFSRVPAAVAPRAPGIAPTWSSSDKDLVGTAMGPARLWYTLGHGIVNEVYYPRIDIPQIRDLGFHRRRRRRLLGGVKRLQGHRLDLPAPGIPLATVVHRHPRFTLTLRVCPDPNRDVLRLEVELRETRQGDPPCAPTCCSRRTWAAPAGTTGPGLPRTAGGGCWRRSRGLSRWPCWAWTKISATPWAPPRPATSAHPTGGRTSPATPHDLGLARGGARHVALIAALPQRATSPSACPPPRRPPRPWPCPASPNPSPGMGTAARRLG